MEPNKGVHADRKTNCGLAAGDAHTLGVRVSMGLEIPVQLHEKTYHMPEYSYGAIKVTLVLKDCTQIQHVFLSSNKIVKLGEKLIEREDQLRFREKQSSASLVVETWLPE